MAILLKRLLSALSRLPGWFWAGSVAVAVLGFSVSHYMGIRAERDRLELQVQVEKANAAALVDSTRVLFEDSLSRTEARLIEQRPLTASEVEGLVDRVGGLQQRLEETNRRPDGVVRRVVHMDTLTAEGRAPVAVDSADVREATFDEDVPGGSLSAHVRLGPTTGWARLTADIDPCQLTDVYTTDGVSAELVQHVGGRCEVEIIGPPVLPNPILENPRPSFFGDSRLWTGVGVGAALVGGLSLLLGS